MVDEVMCPDCGAWHEEPAEAMLGIKVRCGECLLALEILSAHEDEFEREAA